MLKSYVIAILDLLYPKICLICEKKLTEEDFVCARCYSKISIFQPCYSKDKYSQFNWAWSAFIYQDSIKKLIHLFKYKGNIKLSLLLGKLLTEFIKKKDLPLNRIDMIMPIPLHRAKLREREFNQAQLLAKELSIRPSITLSTDNLIRSRATMSQTRLKDKQRWQNVKGAFKLKDKSQIKDKNILLVDDLLTTGATASEAAHVLKKAGSKEVGVLTLAKAM